MSLIAILISPYKFYVRGVKLIFSRWKHCLDKSTYQSRRCASDLSSEYRLIQTQKDDINKCVLSLSCIFSSLMSHPQSHPFPRYRPCPRRTCTAYCHIRSIHAPINHVSSPPNNNASKPSGQKKPKLTQLNASTCMASLSDRKIQKTSYLYNPCGWKGRRQQFAGASHSFSWDEDLN